MAYLEPKIEIVEFDESVLTDAGVSPDGTEQIPGGIPY